MVRALGRKPARPVPSAPRVAAVLQSLLNTSVHLGANISKRKPDIYTKITVVINSKGGKGSTRDKPHFYPPHFNKSRRLWCMKCATPIGLNPKATLKLNLARYTRSLHSILTPCVVQLHELLVVMLEPTEEAIDVNLAYPGLLHRGPRYLISKAPPRMI